MKRKLVSILISLSLVFSLLPASALAAYTDTQEHWAQEAIDKWRGSGIIKGSGGSFRPDDPITRGEMAVIIDRLMKYQTAAENSFTDLGQTFYTDAILKANAAGIITGYGAQVRPADNITREEAVVMLCRAFGIAPSSAASGFSDSTGISSWASGYVSAMAAKGYVQGAQGMFYPKASIKRAEIVTILSNAVSGFYTEAKEYTGDISGIAIINTSGVVLKDMTITGDLIIAEGVGSGDVTLRNVAVTGNTIVRGGGANSIHIVGNSKISNLIIEKTDSGQIRVVTQDGAAVEAVIVDDGSDDIILTGTFESVSITASVSVKVVDAQITTIKVTGENSRIDIDTASAVGTLTADAPVAVSNSGTITKAEVNVDNVSIGGNKPGETTYATGVAGTKDEDTTPGGGGGGGGNIAVTGITVSPATLTLVIGGPAETVTATVTPDNATNKTVTWSSSDETVATVSGGVITPIGVGTATITATAGGKTATVEVTVNPVEVTGITVDKDELTLIIGGAAETVTATVTPDNATDKTVTWSSSDKTVATVSGGVITPVGVGTATITATAGGRSATVMVKVADAYAETFDQLTTAIASAGDGDVIMLGNNEFVGNLTITKPVRLVSRTPREAVITGSITIQNTNGVTIEGLTVNAGAGYDKLPVIHIINSTDITIRDNAVNATPGSMQLSIGTSTGPAKVTGIVSGNTVSGAIGLGTDGNLAVTDNTVTYASHEGIWFYPVGANAALTVTGNDISGFGGVAADSAAIKVESRPASINGVSEDLNMLDAIADANAGLSVKLTWMKTAGDAAQLADEIASARAGDIIVISGLVGGSDDYAYYEITKPITIKGVTPNAAVYGSFIIKCDGVTIDGLTIYTRGGGNGPLKNAIDVIAKTVTITNNTFELPNPDALADSGGVGNGVVIWPVGSAAPDYTVSGNTFIGYSADTPSWSSTALQIAEGLPLARFSMPTVTSQSITLDTEAETALAASNTYTDCTNNYIRGNWSAGPVVYKFVYAATKDQLDSGFQYGGDGVTIVLAEGTYGLTEQRNITKPMTLIGLGQVTLQAQNESWSTTNGYKHLLTIYAGTAANPVVISNITLDSQGDAYGIHAYNGPVVELNDVTVINSVGAGLTVNGSTVTANNLNTSGNAWGAVNVDPGNGVTLPSIFTLTGSGTLSEAKQIWSDGKYVTAVVTVTVNADGYHGYKTPASPEIIWTNREMPTGAGILGDNNVLTLYETIQGAINGAKAGDTIKVMPGTYEEDISINKAITLLGAGADVTKIVATDGNSTPVTFNTNNATVSGFTITHEYTPEELNAWNFNNNGVTFHQWKTGNTLKDCVVTLNRNGIYINNATGNTIQDNIITNNRTGINMTSKVDGTLITGNIISGNWTIGLVYYQLGEAANFNTVTVTGNTFDGNWYSEILIKDTSSSTGTLDVSDNTFMDSPVTYTTSADSSLNEPGFADLKPAALGGNAERPAVDLPTLRIYNSPGATLQYTGKLLVVGDSTGDFVSITDALAVAAEDDTILVGADMTLDATLVINTPGVTIDGLGYSINQAIHINADGVTIKNLTGSANGIFVGGPTAFYITAKGVTLDNITVIGSNEPNSIAVRGYKGAEFTAKNSSFSNLVTGIFAHHGYSEPDAGHNILIAQNNTFTNVLAGIGGTQKTTLTATGNTFESVQDGGEGIGLGDGVVIVGAETATRAAQVAYLESNNEFQYEADNANAYHVRDWRTPEPEEFSDDTFMMGRSALGTDVPDADAPDAAPPEKSKPDAPAPEESAPDTPDPDESDSDEATPEGTAPEGPDGEA